MWSPPGSSEGLPALLVLAGFTGRGQRSIWRRTPGTGLASRIDRAFAAGAFPACHVVFPDCFTALGGSQYLDSSAIGPYQSHVLDELLPFVAEHWGATSFGVAGKSSGRVRRPPPHHGTPWRLPRRRLLSGDLGFDLAYGGELMAALPRTGSHGGDAAAFLGEAFRAEPSLSGRRPRRDRRARHERLLRAGPRGPAGLPAAHGPAHGRAHARLGPLARQRSSESPRRRGGGPGALEFLDLRAGTRDGFHLQFGLRRFVRRLQELGIAHEHAGSRAEHFGWTPSCWPS